MPIAGEEWWERCSGSIVRVGVLSYEESFTGMLMPLSAAESEGYLLPVIFAISTGLPVIIVAWVLAYSVSGLGKFYKNIQVFQKWMNLIIAILFIAVGIYYAVITWF